MGIDKVSSNVLKFSLMVVFLVIFGLPLISLANNGNGSPLCTYMDLDQGNIIKYPCDRFQSKGDKDSITPQVKIVEPENGKTIDYQSDLVDSNGDGVMELPIKIVVNPEFTIDFSVASNPVTQYAFLPQVDGLGHLHGYITPEIHVDFDPTTGEVSGVNFIGNSNRSDFVGGFCAFQNADPELSTEDYQVLKVNCPLQATMSTIENGSYKVSVDFTENSHGPRIKNHPRDNPPEDVVQINITNVP